MTSPSQFNQASAYSDQLYTPPSVPTRQTSRTYTVSRPTSLPVDSRPPHSCAVGRLSLNERHSINGDRRSGSTAQSTPVSMDDVYVVDDVLAKRQSLQPPAYAPRTGLPGYSDNDIFPTRDEQDAPRHSGDESLSSIIAAPSQRMSMISRILIPLLLVLPILTALGLAYFGTSQSDSIRGVVDVVHIRLPQAEYRGLQRPEETDSLVLGPGPLLSIPTVTESQLPTFTPFASHRTVGHTVTASAGPGVISTSTVVPQVARRQSQLGSEGGTLAIGLWGWSLTPANGTSAVASPPRVWDQLYGLFPATDNNTSTAGSAAPGLTRADFPVSLGRMLFLHSVGLLLTMIATVPVLIYVFRKHVRNNAFVNPGWLQHGSLIAATTCNYASWIIDKKYISVVRDNVQGRYMVSSGVCPTLTLSSAALLSVATLASTLPTFLSFLKRQQRRSQQWTKVMEVNGTSTGATSDPADGAASERSHRPQARSSIAHSARPSRWATLARKGRKGRAKQDA